MSTEIDIILKAVDKATAEIKKVTGSLGGLDKSTKVSSLSFTELNSAISLGQQALQAAKQIYESTVTPLLRYSEEVERLTQSTGDSADASSRLYQVADDLKVSYGELETALTAANRKGIDVSREGLMKLSDAYLDLAPGLERSKFLLDTFGRSGKSMAAMMEKGRDSLGVMYDEVEDGLVVTEKAIQAAKDYELAVDGLDDAVTAFKNRTILPLIPVLTDAINLLVEMAKWTQEEKEAYNQASEGTRLFMQAQILMRMEATRAAQGVTEDMQEMIRSGIDPTIVAMGGVGTAAEDAAEDAAKAISDANNTILSTAEAIYKADLDFTAKENELAQDRVDLENERAGLIAQGYSDASQEVLDLDAALAENSTNIDENIAKHKQSTDEIFANLLEAKMKADGEFSDIDQKNLINWKMKHGMMTQQAADEAIQLIDNVAAEYEAMPKDFDVTVTTHHIDVYTNDYGQRAVGAAPGRASGGPVKKGKAYLVGEEGPEPFVPEDDGVILPNEALTQALTPALTPALSQGYAMGEGGRAVTVNFTLNYSPAISLADRFEMETRLKPAVRQIMRDLGIKIS